MFNLKFVVEHMLANMAKKTRKLVKVQNTSSTQYPQISYNFKSLLDPLFRMRHNYLAVLGCNELHLLRYIT